MSKSKKKTVPVAEVPYMKYNTYRVLRDFLEEQQKKAHRDYITAAEHSYEWDYDGMSSLQLKKRECKVLPQSVRDFMWKNYKTQIRYYEDMLKQLYYSAQESNRTHPNPEMQKFWGIQ